jgi:signal transduction histidine kinase
MSAATVAHDLNNLLMALSGLVEGLKGQERNDPFLLTMREEVDLSIDKLTHIAKRLRSSVTRAVPEKHDNVDIKATLHELITLVRKHPDCRSCRVALADIAPLTIVVNRTLLEEAVLNLLINAAQAAGPTGQIEVRLTNEEDAAMLAVHDNGPGVSDDLLENIFEPCFTTKPDGTGIGLLAVKAFAASCGADVSVGRSPLGGALFQLRIPIQNQPSNHTSDVIVAKRAETSR